MSYLERKTLALVSRTLITSAVGQRSDESRIMTQYRRHGSANTWQRKAYHGRTQSWEHCRKESVIKESRAYYELLISYLIS